MYVHFEPTVLALPIVLPVKLLGKQLYRPCLFNQENPALEHYLDNELRIFYKYVSVSLFT